MASITLLILSRPVIALNLADLKVSRLIFTLSSPASFNFLAFSPNSNPFVVMLIELIPSNLANETMRFSQLWP